MAQYRPGVFVTRRRRIVNASSVFCFVGLAVAGRWQRARPSLIICNKFESQLVLLAVEKDPHRSPALQTAEKNLVGQGFLDVFLNHACKRPCAELMVIALLAEPACRFGCQVEGDIAIG